MSDRLAASPQTDRLLQLQTPLDKDYGADCLIPETLTGTELVSSQQGISGFRFELTALSQHSNIPLTPALGLPVLVGLLTAQSRQQRRPFHGHLTRFERLSADGGLTRYRLTIEPWLSFLGYRRDSAVFQDQSVIDIINTVLGRSAGEGAYLPDWRFDLADASVYKPRSLTCQYQETDLDFVHRLMAEEGLYYWFSHSGDTTSPQLGAHRLVVSDHNGAFTDNPQAVIRFTQSGIVLPEDSIDRWQERVGLASQQVKTVSWDYRSHQIVAAELMDTSPSAQTVQSQLNLTLSQDDSPGHYAYANAKEAGRLAAVALDRIRSQRHQSSAGGTVRTAAPGTRFTLADHLGPANPDNPDAKQYLILAVSHKVHNNLKAHQRLADADDQQSARYRNTLTLIPSSSTYRSQTHDQHGLRIHPKPTVYGQQTAIVVGETPSIPTATTASKSNSIGNVATAAIAV